MAAKASCQVTIADITDAYSAVLTSETYTFMGNTSGAPIGSACTTQAMAYQGNIRCSKVTIGTISCPTGISASVSNNGTASPTITFKTTAVILLQMLYEIHSLRNSGQELEPLIERTLGIAHLEYEMVVELVTYLRLSELLLIQKMPISLITEAIRHLVILKEYA